MTRASAPDYNGCMSTRAPILFLFDIDNTLLDNDRVTADLTRYLETHLGPGPRKRYFEIFETLRRELGYADYLGALQRYRVENPKHPGILAMSSWLIDYPFANRLYANSLDAIAHVQQFGPAVVLSDGDVVFQPRKATRSGIAEAVHGNVLIYIHKEEMLDDVAARFPAEHYVMIDDKIRILTAMKKSWPAKLTTVFPVQGHYALDKTLVAQYPAPDITVQRIGDVCNLQLADFLPAAGK
jgi:FMN phosphatase YigB (HAD superfamily)